MNALTHLFKILSDESRLRILMLLKFEPLCVCELCGILDLPQPKISKSLAKLRDLNLVVDERRDKFVFYTLKQDNVLLNKLLMTLEEEMTTMPILMTDRNRLQEKERYLTQCTLTL